jgi:hypothetical protein
MTGRRRAGGPPGRVPQPAGQRIVRHRRRHGDVDSAAQCAELCDAALHLIDNPSEPVEELDARVPKTMTRTSCAGPDFPTGGIVVDSAERRSLEAYETGRGSFRSARKWSSRRSGPRRLHRSSSREIPYGVQKSRLVEKIAELLIARKLPLLEDIRDESADDIRLVLEPKCAAPSIPCLLMESLFKLTELETRFPLNMNVLVAGKVPNVMGLAEAGAAGMARTSQGRAHAPQPASAGPRSSGASKCWAATSSPISTSTR